MKVSGMLVPGNITNLYNRPIMKRMAPDPLTYKDEETKRFDPWASLRAPEYSTIYTASFPIDDNDPNGRQVLVPTVVGGKQLSEKELRDRFRLKGEHLGIFDSPKSADAYANALHNSEVQMGDFYGSTSRLNPGGSVTTGFPDRPSITRMLSLSEVDKRR